MQLSELQELEMLCHDRPGMPLTVQFLDSEHKTKVLLVEGQENEEFPELERSIVGDYYFEGCFDAFEERFSRIFALVGRKIRFKSFTYQIRGMKDLIGFRDHYKGRC